MPFDDPLDKEKREEYGFKSKKILHSKYKQVDVLELSKQQTHLVWYMPTPDRWKIYFTTSLLENTNSIILF
jgi:hypothetical protein